jgi:hypothetical protein
MTGGSVDKEVADWLDNNPGATEDDFLHYLRDLYSRPDVINRFPEGF